jgi:hypothetical protein
LVGRAGSSPGLLSGSPKLLGEGCSACCDSAFSVGPESPKMFFSVTVGTKDDALGDFSLNASPASHAPGWLESFCPWVDVMEVEADGMPLGTSCASSCGLIVGEPAHVVLPALLFVSLACCPTCCCFASWHKACLKNASTSIMSLGPTRFIIIVEIFVRLWHMLDLELVQHQAGTQVVSEVFAGLVVMREADDLH